MEHSAFLIAHPRESAADVEFLTEIQCSDRWEGVLKEVIDVFRVNVKALDNVYDLSDARHLLLESVSALEAQQTDLQENGNDDKALQEQSAIMAKFENLRRLVETRGESLEGDECPEGLRRIISDSTRLRCDKCWRLYLKDAN